MRRKIAAIIAADVVGYSTQIARDEEGTLARLQASRSVFEEFVGRYHGRIFNTAGDSILAEFASAVEAVRCALEIQESLRTKNMALPEGHKMQFRMGINLGDVVERNGDLLGDGVNIAARLEALSAPGGICISRSIYEQVQNKISISFADIGPQSVKNIPTPIHAYVVAAEAGGLPQVAARRAPSPALVAAACGAALVIALTSWKLLTPHRREEAKPIAALATPQPGPAVAAQSPAVEPAKAAPAPAQPPVASPEPQPATTPPAPVARSPEPKPEPASVEPASPSGEYVVTMLCEKLPWTKAPLHQEITAQVKGSLVEFLRPIHWPDRNSPVIGTELGRGQVTSSGDAYIDASWASSRNSFKVRYEGKLTSQGGSLRGRQDWLHDGRKYVRDCELIFRRR
ncbi:MAG: adenylate/guanylate cyclase domain-containing protein [Hyphomicrobiaceae bacterium]|nr:adenylate/guanylate cyclase domain-containing protein [Hyphomicrobiaceae bacterium]